MNIQHNNECDCEICGNGIREERQYAAMQVGERYRIIDADEAALIDEWFENRGEDKKQPIFPHVEPEDDKAPVLVA